jgi:hypothetical protein
MTKEEILPPCIAAWIQFKGWSLRYHNIQDGECIRCGLPESDFKYFMRDAKDVFGKPVLPDEPDGQ